jgi:hypothetical protein
VSRADAGSQQERPSAAQRINPPSPHATCWSRIGVGASVWRHTHLMGVSGRAMIEALIAGERDPQVLAELARGRRGSSTRLLGAADPTNSSIRTPPPGRQDRQGQPVS